MNAHRRQRLVLAFAAAACLLPAALVVMLGASGRTQEIVGMSGQIVAEAVALALCAMVAAHVTGTARVMWTLVTAGLAAWLVADAHRLASVATGTADVPDWAYAVWALFNILTVTALALAYVRLRPEQGWQGVLDAIAMVIALGVVAWMTALRPMLDHDPTVLESFVRVFFPASALAGLAVAGWLALRTSGGPLWLRWICAAFAVQVLGEAALAAAGLDVGNLYQGYATLAFAACAWCWAFAAHERLSWPQRRWAQGDRSLPPAWSHALPVMSTLIAVSVLAWGSGWLGVAVMVGCTVAGVRAAWTLIANQRSLSTHALDAATDPLTGIPNRRVLGVELGRLTSRARAGGHTLTALVMDLDGFKAVNDTLGHAAGDRLLVAVTDAAAKVLRARDRMFRTGGDEFVVLLPDTAERDAGAVAERLRGAVAALSPFDGVPVTASIGVAEGPPRRTSPPEALLDSADAAMYRAKNAGRNRVVHAGPLRGQSGAHRVPAL